MDFLFGFNNSFLVFLYYLFVVICGLQIVGFRDFCRSVCVILLVAIPSFVVYVLPTLAISFWGYWFVVDLGMGRSTTFFTTCALGFGVFLVNFFVYTKWGEVIKEYSFNYLEVEFSINSEHNPLLTNEKRSWMAYGAVETNNQGEGVYLFGKVRDAAKGLSQRQHWITGLFIISTIFWRWDLKLDEFLFSVNFFRNSGSGNSILLIIIAVAIYYVSLALAKYILYWDMRSTSRKFSDFISAFKETVYIEDDSDRQRLRFISSDERTMQKEVGSSGSLSNIYENAQNRLSYVFSKHPSPREIVELSLLPHKYKGKRWLEEASERELSAISSVKDK